MTAKQILKGLRYRLKTLKDDYEVLSSNIEKSHWLLTNYESRIEEVEGLIKWIKKGKV